MGAMSDLRADVMRYRNGYHRRQATLAGLVARRVSLQVLVVYRLGRWAGAAGSGVSSLWRRPVLWLVYAPLQGIVRRAYGIHLDLASDIGPGFYIGHVGGVEVRRCSIGAQCSLAQQTRIGPSTPGGQGPVIGSRVWIGAHARVRGPITIGSGATIAAGAHVSQDVPGHALVAGNPARVVKWFYDNSAILGHPAGAPVAAAATDNTKESSSHVVI
jgi:serine O-acetyltransferase